MIKKPIISGPRLLTRWALFACTLSITPLVFGQSVPEITVPTVDQLPASTRILKKPIDDSLSNLHDNFLNLSQTQLNGLETEQGASILDGKVTIEAISKNGSASELLAELEELGLENGAVFKNLVSGQLPISEISRAGGATNLVFLRMAQRITKVGAAENQGDISLMSDAAKATYSVDGSGVSIGILSDSYDFASTAEDDDISSGDLPAGGVTVLDDSATGFLIDEGRAMAQLVHDIAPGADLLFHTAFNGAADFAQGILDLANAGADVIVDDVGYFSQPMFQDGVIAQAVDTVVANGVAYFSAAGNSADQSYEAQYQDSSLFLGPPTIPFTISNLHTFAPNDAVQEFLVPPGGSLLLSIQWDEPFASAGGQGSASDLDAYLFDDTPEVIASAASNNLAGDAVEILRYTNPSNQEKIVSMVIGVFQGPVPNRIKWVNFSTDVSLYNHATFSSTTYGHPNAAGAMAVGAAYYLETPAFGQAPPLIENFSSHGGTQILFDTAGNSISPVDRNKPEIVAPDGVDTTFFGPSDSDGSGFPNFFGTSAAAPNAAAIAALQLQCDSALSPSDIRFQQTTTAIDMEFSGFDNISGDGLLDAAEVLALACSTPSSLTCNGLAVTVNLNLGQSTGPGDDVVMGTNGADDIKGKAGNDTICGNGGADFIHGNSGDDWIDGGNGVDNIRGGQGDDIIFTGLGSTVNTSSRAFGGTGDDVITGDADNDDLRGGKGEDSINGKGGDDLVIGNNDNDDLNGGAGDDVVTGGSGSDALSGGGGTDDCNGGAGTDTATASCENVSNIP